MSCNQLETTIQGFEVFETADVLYLIGPNYPWKPIRLFPDGRVQGVRNLAAYVLKRPAAEVLMEYVFPIARQIDYWVEFRFLESMQRPGCKSYLPEGLPPVPLLKGYGILEKAPIRLSKDAKKTTFTSTGEKRWIPEYIRVA